MSIKVDKPVKNFLIDFGLTDKEITVYLTLLKSGPNTIMNLARETGIKRSTTHNTVEELIKKGLVSQTNYGERRMVIAEDPDKLKFLMEQKRWDVQKLEKNLPDVVKVIMEQIPNAKENTLVDVKYYQGTKDVQAIYSETLKAPKIYSFFNLDKFYEIFPEGIGLQKKATEHNIKREVYDIVIDTPFAREITNAKLNKLEYKDYKAKFIPVELYPAGFDFIIFENKVAMIQLEKNNPIAIIISSKSIAEGLEALHKAMWSLLK